MFRTALTLALMLSLCFAVVASAQEETVINRTWVAEGYDSAFDAKQAMDRAIIELGPTEVAMVTATNGKFIVITRIEGSPAWVEEPPIMSAQIETPEAAMEEYSKHAHAGCRGMMTMHDKLTVVYWSND
jgi:hypothetical protein